MATRPPSSAGGASTSTRLQSQSDITEYLLMLENDCNVKPPQEDSIMYRMQESEGLPDKPADEMASWEDNLKLPGPASDCAFPIRSPLIKFRRPGTNPAS